MPRSPDPADEEFRARLAIALGEHYELGDVVGQGGFGRVYSARDRRLDRRVAIKVIRPDLAGASAFVDRFRREGVALARLRHPAVVPIYDIREVDGLIFYAMPYIDGPTLAAKLEQRGPLPPKVAHRILCELCDAVAATHRAGILHRDIKPANVILEGRQEKVLLTDFGIARFAEGGDVTDGGVFVGTPTYMAPEQFGGGLPDRRADIYSLGVVAFHLLTGRTPFSGATAAETMMLHATAPVRPLRTINPSVPTQLAAAVERCLEKDPNDRFDTALDLLDQLAGVTFFAGLREEPVEKPPVISRRGAALAALAAVAGASAWLGTAWLTLLAPWQLGAIAAGAATIAVLASPRLRHEVEEWKLRRRGAYFLSREMDQT